MYTPIAAQLRRLWPANAPLPLLAGLTVLLLVGLATPPDPLGIPNKPASHDGRDLMLFREVAARMTHGEAYYPAMGDELTIRGYPTGSVANWRTPLYLELVAHTPLALRGLLLLLGVLVVIDTGLVLRAVSTPAWLAGLLLQIGVVAALWRGDLFVMPEPLTGALVALSVLVFLRGWRETSVLLGMAALFVRELAAPYVGVRLAWAVWRREWREAILWALGLGIYGLYVLWHIGQVHQAMPAQPTWHPVSWIQFGGLRFVLATVRANAWLTMLPWWMTPFALVAALLGAWKAPPVVSLSIVGYFMAFAIVGLPFNWYWGWVPGMLLPLTWAQIGRSEPVATDGARSVGRPTKTTWGSFRALASGLRPT